MSTDTTKPHLAFLDGARGLAAVYIVLHHSIQNVLWTPPEPRINWLLMFATGFGHYAVDVFIVLSGFCLMIPVLRAGGTLRPGEFFRRRAWRILPPYYASMIFTGLLIATEIGDRSGTQWDACIPVTSMDVLTHLLLVQEWSLATAAKINHAYWSIGVEWKIYFLFPLLCASWRRFGPWRTTAFTTATSLSCWVALAWFDVLDPSPWGSSVYYVGLFAMGMLAATISDASRERPAAFIRNLRLVFLLLSGIIVAVSLSPIGLLVRLGQLPLQLRSPIVGAWSSALLVMLRLNSVPLAIHKLFTSSPIRWLGKIGYSLYLIHAPVLQLVYVVVLLPLGLGSGPYAPWCMLALGTLTSILVGGVFYRVVELPFHEISRSGVSAYVAQIRSRLS